MGSLQDAIATPERTLAPRFDIVALVTSAGGLDALSAVLRGLPADFPAAVIAAQHLSGSGSALVDILSRRTRLPVAWARNGARVERGQVHVCRPRTLLEIHPDGTCAVSRPEGDGVSKPLDHLLESLADTYGARALAVVLTGMGSDGARGTAALKRAGGTVIAQNEESAEHPSMPRAAIAAGADLVLPLHEIARVIADVVAGAPLPKPGSELEAIRATFGADGRIARLAREIDWLRHPFGPVHKWPAQLRELVRLIAESPDPAMVLWGEQRLAFFNDPSLATFGERWKTALGRPFADVLPELPGPWQVQSRAQSGEAVRLEKQLVSYEDHGRLRDGWFDVACTPVRGADGTVLGIHAVWFDRTGEVLAARRLHAVNRLASAPPESGRRQALGRALGELGTSGDLPFVAAYVLEETGTRAHLAGVLGITEDSTLAPNTMPVAPGAVWPLHEVVERRRPIVLEDLESRFRGHVVGAEGLTAHCAMLHPLRDEAQDKVVGVLILGMHPRLRLDDTYREFLALVGETINAKMAEAHARQRETERLDRLAELDRAKTEFFSNVSHEFRTPLTLMLAPLEELQRRRAHLPNHVGAEVDVAAGNARRLLTLVNTLLDFSLAEAGRLRAQFEPVDLAALTKDIAAVFRSAVERAGLELKVDAAPLAEEVWVDRSMWEKIVSNLLSNALKFTLEGSITVELRALARHAELVVRDTGLGIPSAEQPHIFKRFHRVRSARARTQEGVGIGLALVHELVRRHHGRIRVLSDEGQGTAFTVWLPLGRRPVDGHALGRDGTDTAPDVAVALAGEAERWSPEQPLPEEILEALGEPQTLVHALGARVLVVDDNPDMRDYLRRLLSKNWHVETAADGEDALDRLRATPADLVLADVMMPRLDGFGLLRAVRADEALKETPVILVTARAGEEAAIEGLVAGADDYIAKPFSARELTARVAGQLEIARARRKTEAVLKARNAELRGQREALEAAMNGAELEVSLGALARTATEALGGGVRAAFYLTNVAGTSLHHVVGMPADSAQAVDGFKVGPEPVISADVMTDPRWKPWRGAAERFDYRGCWSFPIHSAAGQLVGTLAMYWREPREAAQGDLALASLLTHTASIIICRHAESAARKQAEEALRDNLAGMRRLYELHSRLASTTHLRAALDEILDAACDFMRTDRGCIQLVSEDGTQLEMFNWRGYAQDGPFISRFRHEDLKEGGAAAHGERKRFVVPDWGKAAALGSDPALPAIVSAERIGASQSTAIISRKGEMLGVLSTQWREPYQPSDEELRLIDLLAWTAGDFAERHRATQALRRSEQRLRRVLETDAVGVLFFGRDGTLLESNDAFLRMSGYTREQVSARRLHWRDMTPPEWVAESEAQMKRLEETGRIGPYEKEYLRADGSRARMLFAGRDLGDGTIAEFAVELSQQRSIVSFRK